MTKKNPAAQALGKIKTERKAVAARQNATRPRPNRKPKPISDLPCNCDATSDSTHKATCPRGRAYRRQLKASPVVTEDSRGRIAARQAEIRALLTAPAKVRQAAVRASAAVAAAYYATPEGREELADWRAIQGEDFSDD